MSLGKLARRRDVIGSGAHGLELAAHRQQHPPHVRMTDDGDWTPTRSQAALNALASIVQRLLVAPISDSYRLQAHIEPGAVHHHEHGLQPAVLVANQPADRTLAAPAVGHGTGRTAVIP